MSKHAAGLYPHLVISTKDLQDPAILVSYLETNKNVSDYIVSVEYGKTGHPHLDCFCTMIKPVRQDKFKESILKLYSLEDKFDKMNTKVVFNYIDPNPLYGYGYALKENPKSLWTSLSSLEKSKALDYYSLHCENVVKQKEEIASKFKRTTITLDSIAEEYLAYLRMKKQNEEFVHVDYTSYFYGFMKQFGPMIPFSLYQKINQERLSDWCLAYLDNHC